MAANLHITIKKLQTAINMRYDKRILVNKTQWYSDEKKAPQTLFVIKQSVYNKKEKKTKNIELFSSPSQVQIVLFLRDMWYELNGWEVPIDNKVWNAAKKKYYEKREGKTDT